MRNKRWPCHILKKNYTYLIRKVYKESKHWEGLFIDVTSENLQRKITIANIYRPPRDNYSNISIDNFLRPITKIINVMKNENSTLIWVGDFNINLLQIEQREKYQEYFEIFTSNGLLPQITLPTRLSKRKGTLIDQIFCKLSGSVTTATSGILVNKISDHLPCFTCIDVLKQRQKIPKYVKICTKNNAAIQAFKTEVKNKIETTCFENNLLTDPNHNYNKLDNILQNAKKEHLPEKNVKFNKYRHKINPWMTPGILQSIKFRDKLYEKLKSTSSLNDYISIENKLKG